eukprot:SAG31_NODE_3520_length_4165_cov_1.856370_4_plen_150_part_00
MRSRRLAAALENPSPRHYATRQVDFVRVRDCTWYWPTVLPWILIRRYFDQCLKLNLAFLKNVDVVCTPRIGDSSMNYDSLWMIHLYSIMIVKNPKARSRITLPPLLYPELPSTLEQRARRWHGDGGGVDTASIKVGYNGHFVSSVHNPF